MRRTPRELILSGLPLFDQSEAPMPPFRKNSPTSLMAADAIRPELGTLERGVLSVLFRHGPMGADDVAKKLGRHYSAIRPRVHELTDLLFVEVVAGEYAVSAHGKRQAVVRITQKGSSQFRDSTADAHAATFDRLAS